MIKAIKDIPTGARVVKPDAIQFDFAYGRKGTVIRQTVAGLHLQGVHYDGGRAVIQYPDNSEFMILQSEVKR